MSYSRRPFVQVADYLLLNMKTHRSLLLLIQQSDCLVLLTLATVL